MQVILKKKSALIDNFNFTPRQTVEVPLAFPITLFAGLKAGKKNTSTTSNLRSLFSVSSIIY